MISITTPFKRNPQHPLIKCYELCDAWDSPIPTLKQICDYIEQVVPYVTTPVDIPSENAAINQYGFSVEHIDRTIPLSWESAEIDIRIPSQLGTMDILFFYIERIQKYISLVDKDYLADMPMVRTKLCYELSVFLGRAISEIGIDEFTEKLETQFPDLSVQSVSGSTGHYFLVALDEIGNFELTTLPTDADYVEKI